MKNNKKSKRKVYEVSKVIEKLNKKVKELKEEGIITKELEEKARKLEVTRIISKEKKVNPILVRESGLEVEGLVCLVYITSTLNNTIITITDWCENPIGVKTPGMLGLKGAKRGTPLAAEKTGQAAGEKIKGIGYEKVIVIVKGFGKGREAAIKGMKGVGINIIAIQDRTPVVFNGCRKKKPRRV